MPQTTAEYTATHRAKILAATGLVPQFLSWLRSLGLTASDYWYLAWKGCGICGALRNPDGTRLALDHDHETGIVRGALCRPHNAAIGLLADDPVMVEKALRYLNG